ncbi:uncharacterized protein LOC136092363 [Hydra vulgaris]|uniref:Uncharacterized protein LOC136092363 n=1 Tax=Hydra vulgaris TaxID=6087 RepID=A0ABM4DPI8_HYDVU
MSELKKLFKLQDYDVKLKKMIRSILFFIAYLMHNEAYDYFSDDLNYAGAMGKFIPFDMDFNDQTLDTLLARKDYLDQSKISIDPTSPLYQVKNIIEFINAIQKAKRDKSIEVPLYNQCTAKVTFENPIYTLVAGDKCNLGINIGLLTSKLFENFNIDVLSSDFIQSNKLLLRSLVINDTYVSIDAGYNGIYSHSQSMIKLDGQINLKLEIPRSSPSAGRRVTTKTDTPKESQSNTPKFNFVLEGKLNGFETIILYNLTESPMVNVSITVPKITVKDFIKLWSLTPEGDELFLEHFKSMEISATVKGFFNTIDKHFQLFAEFTYDDKQGIHLDINLVIDKTKGKPVAAALVVKLDKIKDIVNYLKTKFGYKGPDFIKELLKSATLSLSNTSIDLIEYENFFKLNGKVQKSVEPGIHIYLETDMKSALKNCAKKEEPPANAQTPTAANAPKKNPPGNDQTPTATNSDSLVKTETSSVKDLIKISISTSGVVISLPKEFSEDLKTLMDCFLREMNVYVQTKVVPSLLDKTKQPNMFYISELSFLDQTFKMTLAYNGDIDIGFGVVLSKPTFAVSKKNDSKEPWNFEAQANVSSKSLTDSTNKGKIEITFNTHNYSQFNIKIPALDITNLAKYFGANPFDDATKNFENSFNIAIKDLYIDGKLNLTSETGELTVTASPVINGMTGLTLAAFIWKEPKVRPEITFGFVMKNMRLDKALKQFANVNMTDSWLSNVTIVMLISTAKKSNCEGKKSENPECQKSSATTSSKPASTKPASAIARANTNPAKSNTSPTSSKPSTASSSKESKKKTHFDTIDDLRDIEIGKGFVLRANVSLDTDVSKCNGNGICKFLVENKVEKIYLHGSLLFDDQNKPSVTIKAGIEGTIQLGQTDDVVLKNVFLELEFGATNNKISLNCEFHIKYGVNGDENKSLLKIKGFIMLDLSGQLKIGGSMDGIVKKPFDIQWLAFDKLRLNLGLDLKTGLPSIEMGAEIWLGKITDDELPSGNTPVLFKFYGAFGINAAKPTECFFYARSFGSNLTIKNVLEAIGSKTELPSMVAESGFVDEIKFSVSFYTEEKRIEEFDFSISPGVMFKGKISILGYIIECDLRFDHIKREFLLDAKFDPIDDWGSGLIKLYRSAEDLTNGPVFYLKLVLDPFNLDVCIKGYINILGIAAGINIKITDQSFSFLVTGNLWGVLNMSIAVSASYSNSKLQAFCFEGCVGLDIIKIVSESAKESVEAAQKKANAVFELAKKTLEKAEKDVEEVKKKIESWEAGIEKYKEQLENRKKQINEEMEKLKADCGPKCGTVCIPFFGWKSHCTTIWGRPVGCVTWDYCKWTAPNLVCIAACEINKGLAKFAAWAEKLGIKILQGLADIGGLFLKAASGLTEIGKGIIKMAEGVLNLAKATTNAVFNIAKSLTELKIDSICVNAKFDPETKTCVGYSLKGSYVGMEFSFSGSLCIDLATFRTLGSKSAKTAEPQIEKLDESAASIDANSKEVERACNELSKNASKLESDVKSKTSDKIEKRSHVPTEDELRIHKLIYDPLPLVNLRSEETVNAMKSAVPWEYLGIEDIGTKDAVVRFINNASSRHQIPNEESHDFCHQHQNVLSRYSTIADGFSSAIKHVNEAKKGYINQKRSYLNQIDHLNFLIRSGPLNNMTLSEQQDITYWRDYADNHIKSYLDKAASVFHGKKRDSINNVRQTINDVIVSERGVKLPEYINYLHSLAVKADKKSQVNTKPYNDYSLSWHHIKEILLNVASDELLPTPEIAKQIDKVQKMLSSMKRSRIPCAA